MRAKSKIWIENADEVIFGEGRMKLLEAVKRTGSLNQAAQEMKMSYRAAWGKIKSTEKRLGMKLLSSRTGGGSGGGSELTSEAKDLLGRFEKFQAEANRHVDKLYAKYFQGIGE